MPDYPDPGTFEMITVSNAVKTITAAIITPTSGTYVGRQPFYALITVDGADIRITMEGTAPVGGSVGHLLKDGSSYEIHGKVGMMKLKMIRNATTDANVAVTCYF